MANLCLDVVIETDETWAPQIRQRKFQMHNKEWLEVVDEDEAEEYQDAVALNNAMASLHMNQPLDAAALDDTGFDAAGYGGADGYGGYGYGDDPAGSIGGNGVPGSYADESDYANYGVGDAAALYGGARGYGGYDGYGDSYADLASPGADSGCGDSNLAHETAALNNAMASLRQGLDEGAGHGGGYGEGGVNYGYAPAPAHAGTGYGGGYEDSVYGAGRRGMGYGDDDLDYTRGSGGYGGGDHGGGRRSALSTSYDEGFDRDDDSGDYGQYGARGAY